jgi:hypothetical protein
VCVYRGGLPEHRSSQHGFHDQRGGASRLHPGKGVTNPRKPLVAEHANEMLRAARNQSLYREINETIEDLNRDFTDTCATEGHGCANASIWTAVNR